MEDAAGVESPVPSLVQVLLQVAGEAGPEPAPGKQGSDPTDLRPAEGDRKIYDPFEPFGNVSAFLKNLEDFATNK